jgi:heme/copper-type cytochrome/quinol oxidase subunit 3
MPDLEEPTSPRWRPWLVLPFGLLWLGGTILKEIPLFWRNVGGYPVTLRALVLDFYYPFMALVFVSAAIALWVDLTRGIRPNRTQLVGWVIVGAVLGAGFALLTANNLVNLIEGRPLHEHLR